jgi:hypothetical protein
MVSILLAYNLFGGHEILDTATTIKIPVTSKTQEEGIVQFRKQDLKVTFVDATAKIDISEAPKAIRWTGSVFLVLQSFAILYFVYMFYCIIRNVRNNIIFDRVNFGLLSKLGWGLIIYGAVSLLIDYLQKYWFTSELMIKKVSITPPNGNFLPLLIGGLFVLTLAHVFQKSLELEKENKLTI